MLIRTSALAADLDDVTLGRAYRVGSVARCTTSRKPLSRLRELFRDPLLVRHARGLSPTPRAQALAEELALAMKTLSSLVSRDASFDPDTTVREFTLACTDYCGALIGPSLAALLQARAPGATLRLVPLELLSPDGLASTVDVHVGMPPRVPTGCRSSSLFKDSFACLVRKPSAASARRMTLKEYTGAQHVRVSVLGSRQDPMDRALAERGMSRRVVLTVPQFSLLPGIVAAPLQARRAPA